MDKYVVVAVESGGIYGQNWDDGRKSNPVKARNELDFQPFASEDEAVEAARYLTFSYKVPMAVYKEVGVTRLPLETLVEFKEAG